MRDSDTGLIYMHHRYNSPQLGHLLNPDFRAPDIYDPTSFTEPYAFAAGNPMMFWDPNGLISTGDFLDREITNLAVEYSEAKSLSMKLVVGSTAVSLGAAQGGYKLLNLFT